MATKNTESHCGTPKGDTPVSRHTRSKLAGNTVEGTLLTRGALDTKPGPEAQLHELEKLHLGCGSIRLPGFLNVDSRPTESTDLVADCADLTSLPRRQGYSLIYSHAFLEHLYFLQRERFLRSLRDALAPSGVALFVGIPDFRRVAEAYLARERGILRPTFDLFEVYRYTHGLPEMCPEAWQAMLHKSLFDLEVMTELLENAEFEHFSVFSYCFGDESIPVNLGFAAQRSADATSQLGTQSWLAKQLAVTCPLVNSSSIEIRVHQTPGVPPTSGKGNPKRGEPW